MTTTITDTNAALWGQYKQNILASDYDSCDRTLLQWLADHALDNKYNLTEMADKVDMSKSTLQRIMTGNYGANQALKLVNIINYKSRVNAQRLSGGLCPYVHTDYAQQIWSAAEFAMITKEVMHVSGKTQRGKTTAIKEFARHTGKMVIFVRCPVQPSPFKILRRIAQAMGAGENIGSETAHNYIKKRLTTEHLLVIDEVHQIILHNNKPVGKVCAEQIRDIRDDANCGMLLIGTNIWHDALTKDLIWRGLLEQLLMRGTPVPLSDKLSDHDLRKIWQAYSLPDPAPDQLRMVRQIAHHYGLGRYTHILANGHTVSVKAGQPYNWQHFAHAVATLEAISKGLFRAS